MAGKIILYILGALFIIPGLGNFITGLATSSEYGNAGAGRIGSGFIFLLIGSLLIWAGSRIRVNKG